MSASAVQFRGKEDVIEAYEANNVPAWALFCGKNIFYQYTDGSVAEGAGLLDEWLTRLEKGSSGALYQLRIYKNLKKEDIDNTTPFNFSFSFRLCDQTAPEGYNAFAQQKTIADRLGAIEKRLREQEEEEPERIGGIAGFFSRLLDSQDGQQMVMGMIGHVIGRIFGGAQQPASMSGVPNTGDQVDMTQVYANLPEDQRTALDEALKILLTGDPQAGTRLLKIARILQQDPAKYNILAKML